MTTKYPDTPAGAMQCLTDNAIATVTTLVTQQMEDGTAAWFPDPDMAGTWALVRTDQRGKWHSAFIGTALVVVYCNAGDFELSGDFESEVLA